MNAGPFTLVLSGGGLKGLAHVGVLKALEERGRRPALVVGSSMGSMVAGAWAAGMPLDEMEERALAVRRRDVFRVAHVDMAIRRMHAPALYRREPLDALLESVVGNRTFHDLQAPLLVNTVDLLTGQQVTWGLPGRRTARLTDAIFASCALPGVFPPREIGGHYYVDGAVVENLPVRVAATAGTGDILAINVAATSAPRTLAETEGFAATYVRGLEIVMQTQIEGLLRDWAGPPITLVEPRVAHVGMFSFHQTRELIDEGYRATSEALDLADRPAA
ncbi:MAG TPA: patatin-like phospholipase family protein [Verrucomicrobiae bacterium]|jgi:NTE family protein|nr:patatin-like phospholipase family protein [Verrucomicrobiae bacterium]